MKLNDPSFMRLDELLPTVQPKLREEALAELAKRYFKSRGPATLQDFATWSGLLIADARAGLEAAKAELVTEIIEGESYWSPPRPHLESLPSPMAYAPPGFDEYLLGYKDRTAVLAPQHAQKVCPGGNGVFHPTMVLDGQVVGTWKRSFKKGKIFITPMPFGTLSNPEKDAFVLAIQHYGAFLQMPIEVT
jgi:hypothetical protein